MLREGRAERAAVVRWVEIARQRLVNGADGATVLSVGVVATVAQWVDGRGRAATVLINVDADRQRKLQRPRHGAARERQSDDEERVQGAAVGRE